MTQRTALAIVLAHVLVTWMAVPFRIDQFPLTWAPMYSVQEPTDDPTHEEVLKDRAFVESKGWWATRRDGRNEWIPRAAINVPRRSMWRLYYERTWDHAPPKHRHSNAGGWTPDRWILGLETGAPLVDVDWQRRLLVSLNATLERDARAPDFIVGVVAKRSVMRFDRSTLELIGRREQSAEIRWRDGWERDLRE